MPAGTKVSGKSYGYQVLETEKGFGLPVDLGYEPDRAGFLRYDEETGIVEKFDGDILGWNPIAGDNNYPTSFTYELGELIIGRNGLSDLSVTLDKATLGLDLVENIALSTWAGSDNITNVGVITDGVWNGMAISPLKGGLPPGGTVGQVIKKLSSTDYDVAWGDEDGVGGGSSAWGDITGTLSDQIDLITALNGKQPSDSDLTAIAGLTPSNDDIIQRKAGAWTNRTLAQYKVDLLINNVDNTSDIDKPVSTLQAAAISEKQDELVSGTNIKTINGSSILGSGNITISGGTTYTFSDGLSETGGAVIIPANGITTAKINALAVNDSKISDVAWAKITGTPTTVAGYGITDAVTLTGAQTITNKTINGANNSLSNIALGSLAQTGATLNQIIRWNGTAWVASTETSGGSSYTFTPSDFNESGSTISIDYTNGQSASGSTKGFLTAADWITFNGKQNQITTGSTAQYFRGDLSLATFPTNVSSWVNDSGYLVNITGKLTAGTNVSITGSGTTASPYVISSTASGVTDGDKGDITVAGASWTVDALAITNTKINDVAWSKVTGTPTTVAGYGITDAVTLTGTQTITNKTLTSPKINVGGDATGDVYTRDGSGNLIRIPIGSAGQVLKVVSGLPAWAADATGGGGGSTLADGDYGDVTVSATGTAIFIDNGVVTNAKLANVATATLKGRITAGSGLPEDLTGTQATTLLDVFSSTLKGLVPLSGGGTVNFLRADGSWAAPSGGTTYIFTAADFNESGTTISIDYVNGQKATSSVAGFLTAADWTTFNNKQPAITTGSTAQYFRGDLSLATFPTTISTFTNDSGYLTNITGKVTAGTNVSITGSGTAGSPYVVSATLAGTVTGISGTTNRITSTGGATPVIDISAAYVGQTSIITLGTITTGTWNASAIASSYGGVPTGGTAGQILAKISGTNYATQWIPAPTLELIPGFGIIIDGENNISVDPDILGGGGITAITGDIAASGSGSVTGTIQANAVTTSKIADANVTNAKIASVAWSKITSTPTTVSGYGITDAVTLTGTQTISNKTLTSPKINVGSDATGDLYYRDSSGNLVRLAVGSDGQVLKITSGLPAWGTDISGGGGVSDGTFADIIISGTGTIYTVTNNAITTAKILDGNVTNAKLANSTIIHGAPGTSGTAPNWSASSTALGGTATLNIPLASASGVTAGLISKTNYDTWQAKQEALVSGTNIKTINGSSVLGSGNLSISTSLADGNYTDWTVSGTGTVAIINSNAITTTKIADSNVTNSKIAAGVDAIKLADGSVTNTELQYINSLTSNAQTQIDGKIGTLAAIGATPNANGGTITSGVLNLQPASASFGGVLTTGVQELAGNKNFIGYKNTFTGRGPIVNAEYEPSEVAASTIANGKYNGFGFPFIFLDGTFGDLYVESDDHVGNNAVLKLRKSKDGGTTWTTSTIFSNPGEGIGFGGGGISRSGRLIIFLWDVDPTAYPGGALVYTNLRITYSDDQGTTWSTPSVISTLGLPEFNSYGRLQNIGNDEVLLSWYGYDLGTGVFASHVIKSPDDGVTWGSSIVVESNTTDDYTESTFLYLGGSTIIGLLRSEVGGHKYAQYISTDNGDTWTDQGDVSFGQNGTPAWLEWVTQSDGSRRVVAYFREGTNEKAIYANAYNLINSGPSAWDASSERIIATGISGSGYLAVVHPLNKPMGLGRYYSESVPLEEADAFYIPIAGEPFGGGVTINNNADNRIITGSGTPKTLNGEANLTYDGSTFVVNNSGVNYVHILCGSTSSDEAAIYLGESTTDGEYALFERLSNALSAYGLNAGAYSIYNGGHDISFSTLYTAGAYRKDMLILANGNIRMGSLAGNGTGVVGVDNNGELFYDAGGGGSNWYIDGVNIYRPSLVGIGAAAISGVDLHINKTTAGTFWITGGTSAENTASMAFTEGVTGDIGTYGGISRYANATTTFGGEMLIYNLDHKIVFSTDYSGGYRRDMIIDEAGLITISAIKITGGTPGIGKVLTSDADGDATWQDPAGGGSSQWTDTTGGIYYEDYVTIGGTSAPNYALDVIGSGVSAGSINTSGEGTFYGYGYFGNSVLLGVSSAGNATIGTAATNTDIVFVGWNGTLNAEMGRFKANGNLQLVASSYINFGGTSGTSGYGFRDNGGTIQFKNSAGSWADLGSGGGSGTVTSVGVSGGTTGLTTSGGPITSTGTITLAGTLIAANGGTGQTTYSVGDILYASGSTTLSKLSAGTANYYLGSNGSGNAPSWKELPGAGQDAVFTTLFATTTDNTPLEMTGSMPISNGEAGLLEVTVYAINSTSSSSFTKKIILPYLGNTTTSTLIGAGNDIITESGVGLEISTASFDVDDNSSGDIIVTAIGVSGQSIQWRAEIKKYSVYWSA